MQISWFLLELQMFFCEFQSPLALVDVVLMQAHNLFRKYSQGDLTAKVLFLGSFVLHSIAIAIHIRVESELDDKDNQGHLGHFVEGSSGSHPQTMVNYLDVTRISHVL